MIKEKIVIIGAGRVGSNLAIQLNQKGYPINGIFSERLSDIQILAARVHCEKFATDIEFIPDGTAIIFIATPDSAIESVARKLAHLSFEFKNVMVYHLSGSMDSSALKPLQKKSAMVASVHPIQSFLPVESGLTSLEKIYFGLEGDLLAVEKARRIVTDLGGIPFEIPASMKPLYHAGCVVASNYLIALIHICTRIFRELGKAEPQSIELIAPLVTTTFNNIKNKGLQTALTGPISRGDVSTVQDHLAALTRYLPECVQSYQALGKILVDLTREGNKIDSEIADQFDALFLG